MIKRMSAFLLIAGIMYITGCARGVSKETMNQLEEAKRAVEAAKATLNECKAEKENLAAQKAEKEEMFKKLQAERDSLAQLLELIKQGY